MNIVAIMGLVAVVGLVELFGSVVARQRRRHRANRLATLNDLLAANSALLAEEDTTHGALDFIDATLPTLYARIGLVVPDRDVAEEVAVMSYVEFLERRTAPEPDDAAELYAIGTARAIEARKLVASAAEKERMESSIRARVAAESDRRRHQPRLSR